MSAVLSRRQFLRTSRRRRRRPGCRLPHSRGRAQPTRRALPTPDEVNAWVVIKPDDTVVIRIARSEMGQGTLTGLAQLVAEELDCNWAKVTTEYPTPGQNLARNRVWGNFSTGGSRGIRDSHEYVRKGGAAARMMLVQAAANEWKVPAIGMHRQRRRHHARAERPQRPLRQGRGRRGEADAADGCSAQGSRRTGRSPASAWRASTPRDKVTGAQIYGMDLKMPGHAQRRDQGLPGLRRQGQELRRRGDR